jgi:hypothetical protein
MTDNRCKTFTDPQHSALNTLVNQIRKIIDQSVHLDAPEAVLQQASEQLVNITDTLAPYVGKKCLPQYNGSFPAEDPNSFLPYSPVSGRFNPIAPPLEYAIDGDRLHGEVTLGGAYEGPPNSVHGGIISLIYDQLLAILSVTNNTPGPTAYLNVSYLQPTPLNQPLRFEAWIDKIEGKKVTILGECYANDQVVTRCEALFIRYIPKAK